MRIAMTLPLNLRSLLAASALCLGATAAQAQQATQPAPRTKAPDAAMVGHGPNGATLRCRDGSYPAPGAADSACEGKGGVLVRFPLVRRPEAASATRQQNTPPARDPRLTARDTILPDGVITHEAMRRQVEAANALGGRPPAGATLLCVNGTYVVADTSSTRCAQAGGVRLRFESRRP
jgi:hypothetical protein